MTGRGINWCKDPDKNVWGEQEESWHLWVSQFSSSQGFSCLFLLYSICSDPLTRASLHYHFPGLYALCFPLSLLPLKISPYTGVLTTSPWAKILPMEKSELVKLSFYYLHKLALAAKVSIHLSITTDMPRISQPSFVLTILSHLTCCLFHFVHIFKFYTHFKSYT